jgi:hypothetical protein
VIVLYILGFIWALPLTLVELIVLPFYGPVAFRWRDGVLLVQVKRLIGFKTTAGQSFGAIIFFKQKHTPDLATVRERLFVHERMHVMQTFVLGILFAPAYGIACLVAKLQGKRWYQDNYFEVQARAAEPPPT